MIRLNLQQLRDYETSGKRPAGYVARLLSIAKRQDGTRLWIDDDDYRQLAAESNDAAALAYLPNPIPRDQWPLAARVLARLAKPGDAGLGDVVRRLAAKVGGEQYKRLAKRLGYDCGCEARRIEMNEKYPLTRLEMDDGTDTI